MLTLSTTTATPSTSKTLSSSLALSKASAYWKPEQPPPRTATRSACSAPSGCEPSSSPIFSTALSVRVIAAWGVSVTSQSVAGDGGPGWSARLRIAICELACRDRGRLRHDCLPAHRPAGRAGDQDDQPLRLRRRGAGARVGDRRLRRASTSGCAPPKAARPPRSLRSATSSRSTNRCSPKAGKSSRSTSRPASPAPSRPPGRRASG